MEKEVYSFVPDKINVVLIEYPVSNIDIKQLIKNLRDRISDSIYIFMLMEPTYVNREKVFALGADDYLSVPLLDTELYMKVTRVCDRMNSPKTQSKQNDPSPKERLFATSCKFLVDNMDCDIALNDLCVSVGCNRNKLNAIFNAMVGCGPMAWLREQRLLKSMELIKTTRKPIHLIALDVGFSNFNYFSTLFKKRFGYQPSSLRGCN